MIHGQETKQLEKSLDVLSHHQNAPGLMRMISPLGRVFFSRGDERKFAKVAFPEVLGTSGVFHMNGICQDYMKQVLLPIFHVGGLVSTHFSCWQISKS